MTGTSNKKYMFQQHSSYLANLTKNLYLFQEKYCGDMFHKCQNSEELQLRDCQSGL